MPDDVKPIISSMAAMTTALTLPEKFTFEALDWEPWARRWERYRMCRGLDKQPRLQLRLTGGISGK